MPRAQKAFAWSTPRVPRNHHIGVALVKHPRIAQFAWIVFIYNLFVVAWGGCVRASFSGARCCDNWPLCDGKILPAFASLEQIFEFGHRITSVLVLVFVGILMYRVFKAFPKGHGARR